MLLSNRYIRHTCRKKSYMFNPSTFARDAEVLVNKGYNFKSAGIMNMFAQTSHVESIGVFEL